MVDTERGTHVETERDIDIDIVTDTDTDTDRQTDRSLCYGSGVVNDQSCATPELDSNRCTRSPGGKSNNGVGSGLLFWQSINVQPVWRSK